VILIVRLRPLLADYGLLSKHSRLPVRKNPGLARPAGVDPNRMVDTAANPHGSSNPFKQHGQSRNGVAEKQL